MPDRRRFKFIINPEAGRGKSRNLFSVLHSMLLSRGVEFSIDTTKMASEAIDLARESSKDFDVVVAVGGDGTANEVANGVFGSNASMGVIPSGSGNDFGKLLGMSDDIAISVERLLDGQTRKIDCGTVSLESDGAPKHVRKFVNSIGIGFDAIVAYESQRIKHLNGLPLYLLSVGRSFKKLRPHPFKVAIDGKTEEENYALVCVGNGNREGGGFYVTPNADPCDGEFEVCTVKAVSILRALRILPTLLTGKHGQFQEVEFHATRHVSVVSGAPFVVHCDGEILGTQGRNIDIELSTASLNVIVAPSGFDLTS